MKFFHSPNDSPCVATLVDSWPRYALAGSADIERALGRFRVNFWRPNSRWQKSHGAATTPSSTTLHWRTSTIPVSPRIALIDTGIEKEHPCFRGAKIHAKDFTGGTQADDESGHGSHCAALLMARPEGGLVGLVPDAVLLSAKVLPAAHQTTGERMAQAVRWALRSQAQIILLTLGSPLRSRHLAAALDLARRRGVAIVAAAGNHGGSLPAFPARHRGVICVSALGRNGHPLPECYAGGYVDAFAPGERILSARLGGWGEMSGSSQAAAIFCGLLARSAALEPRGSPG